MKPPSAGPLRRATKPSPPAQHRIKDSLLHQALLAFRTHPGTHRYLAPVRFVTGAAIGYLGGLIGIGAAFSANQSNSAVWLTVILAAIPAVIVGESLAKFAGKGAEHRQQLEGEH